ncbi:hypothetical protein [Proteus mirabilis]|uniref:hypothetical protein n=1 Tax=Proteus mirabilis TaxID=584 RepID=UPI0034D6448C
MDDENLPGGNKWCFLSSFALRLTSAGQLKKDKDFGIAGRKVTLQALKSRTSFNDLKIPIVLTSLNGFDTHYTNLLTLKDAKLLNGTGQSGYSFKGGNPDIKFKLKEFGRKLENDEVFRDEYYAAVDRYWGGELAERAGSAGIRNASSDMDSNDYDEDYLDGEED